MRTMRMLGEKNHNSITKSNTNEVWKYIDQKYIDFWYYAHGIIYGGSFEINIQVIVALRLDQGVALGEKLQLNNEERYQRVLNRYWS